jgi:hypothetical protein
VLACYRISDGDDGRLDRRIAEAVTAAAGSSSLRDPDRALRWAMGQIMPSFLGRIAPAIVRDRLAAALTASAVEPSP